MRTLVFTLLAIMAGMAIHFLLEYWKPANMTDSIHNLIYASHLLLPAIATAGLAYAMRIASVGYAIALTVFSPFISLGLHILFALFVLDAPML